MDGRTPHQVDRERIRQRLLLWLAGSVVGTAVIALPDDGRRIFSLSRDHGPSLLDLVGIAVLVAAWLPIPALLLSRPRPFGGAAGRAALALLVAGIVLLVVTIGLDLGAWYLVPVALLLGVQVVGLRRLWARARPGTSAPPTVPGPHRVPH